MSTQEHDKTLRPQTRKQVQGFRVGMRLARRDVRHWTQKRLAREATIVAKRYNPVAGVSVATVGMIESGERNPSLEVATWLAEALGYELADLCTLLSDSDEQVAS